MRGCKAARLCWALRLARNNHVLAVSARGARHADWSILSPYRVIILTQTHCSLHGDIEENDIAGPQRQQLAEGRASQSCIMQAPSLADI